MTLRTIYDQQPSFVGPPNPDTDYPPPGDKAAWAAWWKAFNARYRQMHEIDGTSPGDGLEDLVEGIDSEAGPR
jgi:hypothetical protein